MQVSGPKRKQVRKACINCRKGHRCCEDERPCKRCQRTGKVCEEDDELRLEIHVYPKVKRGVPLGSSEQSAKPGTQSHEPSTTSSCQDDNSIVDRQDPETRLQIPNPSYDKSHRSASAVEVPTHQLAIALQSQCMKFTAFGRQQRCERPARSASDAGEDPELKSLILLRDSFLSGQAFADLRNSAPHPDATVANTSSDSVRAGKDSPPPASVSAAPAIPSLTCTPQVKIELNQAPPTSTLAFAKPASHCVEPEKPELPLDPRDKKEAPHIGLNRTLPPPAPSPSSFVASVQPPVRQPASLAHLLNA